MCVDMHIYTMVNRDIHYFLFNHGYLNAEPVDKRGLEHGEAVILLRILAGNMDCVLRSDDF